MASNTLLSVIIVSYNTSELTLQTLKSVEAEVTHSKLLKDKTVVCVVDNNSSDSSVAEIKKFKKLSTIPVTLISNTSNKGFGAANNQAIKATKANYYVFLNSDTIVQKGGLSRVVSAFQIAEESNPEVTSELSSEQRKLDKVGIIASTLLNADSTHQAQGGDIPSLLSLFSHMFFLDDIPFLGNLLPSTQHTGKSGSVRELADSDTSLIPMGWVGGTALFASKKMLDEIGNFDENIFMYGEDVELCIRARGHNWNVAIHPEAKIIHLQNMSSSSKNALVGELLGYLYIWSKHKPLWQTDFAKSILSIGVLLRIVLFSSIVQDRHKAAAYKEALKKIRQF